MADDYEVKVGHTYHMSISKHYVRGLIEEDQDASYLDGFESHEVEEALAALDRAPEYLSSCSHVDEKGRCLGHPPEDKPE